MLKKRLIAVLILRNSQVVQSVRFEHTNVIHADAIHAIESFNKWAVDEIVMLNVTPTSDTKADFVDTVARVSRQCFVPLAVGGWITDMDYAAELLTNGADKIVVNTILQDEPDLVSALSSKYGKQCIVASMDVKQEIDSYEVMVDRGTRSIAMDPVKWAQRAEELGAGEIFFNSINHDGARKGYHLELIKQICQSVTIPVIAFGGVFKWEHLVEGIHAGADAAAAANIFHYTEHATKKAKRYMANASIAVRSEGR